jgi:hypothetical protein
MISLDIKGKTHKVDVGPDVRTNPMLIKND